MAKGFKATGQDNYDRFLNLAGFPATGDPDKLYLAEDTGFLYQWTGAAYVKTGGETTEKAATVVDAALLQNVINYLESRPHREVRQLIDALMRSKPTIEETKTEDKAEEKPE